MIPSSRYSPSLRTALVLTGSGTAGAYHAGVLQALRQAGVRIDLVAGRGIGVIGAIFSAIDGSATLWDAGGVWRSAGTRRLYGWRGTIRAATWVLVVALAALLVPLTALVSAAIVYPVGFLLRLVGLEAGEALATGYTLLVDAVFQPTVLPLYLPRFVMMALLTLLGILAVGEALPRLRVRQRRRARGLAWWRLLGSPLNVSKAVEHFTNGLWGIMCGPTRITKPTADDLAERYAELLSANVGQPGFRELIVTVYDLDASRDLVFGLLAEEFRRPFFLRKLGTERSERHLETMDLAGPNGLHVVDALTASLSLPIVTDPHLATFASDSQWRGETHHLCDRPDSTSRLLEEVANAGVEQVVLVSALPEPQGPHTLQSERLDARERTGEYLAALETASVRDALATCGGRFQAVFQIRPAHNAVGPFNFNGGYDELSDRRYALDELVDRGREDGFGQFVDAVVGASGEWVRPKPRDAGTRSGATKTVPTQGSDF